MNSLIKRITLMKYFIKRIVENSIKIPILIFMKAAIFNGGAGGGTSKIKKKIKENKYKLYCLLLYSDLDRQFYKYLKDTHQSLSIISGEDIFMFWFENFNTVYPILVSASKKKIDPVNRNHSFVVARMLGIPNSKMPCLVFFRNLESKNAVVYSFDNEWGFNHMSEHIKAVFDTTRSLLSDIKEIDEEKLIKGLEKEFAKIRIGKWARRVSSRQSFETLLKTLATGASLA